MSFIHAAGKEETSDSTGTTCYMKAYKTLKFFPVISFLEGIENSEMSFMHWGCGLRPWNQVENYLTER